MFGKTYVERFLALACILASILSVMCSSCPQIEVSMPGVGQATVKANTVSMSPLYPNGSVAVDYEVMLETVAVVENKARRAAGGNCFIGWYENHINVSSEQHKKLWLQDCECQSIPPSIQLVGENLFLYTAGTSFTHPDWPGFQLNITGAFPNRAFQRELEQTGHYAQYEYVCFRYNPGFFSPFR
jgi:hypothetical protein